MDKATEIEAIVSLINRTENRNGFEVAQPYHGGVVLVGEETGEAARRLAKTYPHITWYASGNETTKVNA